MRGRERASRTAGYSLLPPVGPRGVEIIPRAYGNSIRLDPRGFHRRAPLVELHPGDRGEIRWRRSLADAALLREPLLHFRRAQRHVSFLRATRRDRSIY